MMNLDQAVGLADRILAEERRQSADNHWWAARVPVLLRCDALQALEPYERMQVIDAVERRVTQQQSLAYLIALLGVAFGGALLLLVTGGPSFDAALAAYLAAVSLPSLAYARWLLRPRIRAAALEFAQSKSSTRKV